MSDLNKAMIIGRLGRDPEIRYTADGKAVANFSLATSDKWRDKQSGDIKERTEWHNIVVFGRLAEICGEYLSKGKQAFIEGKLVTRQWEKDGVKRTTTEIQAVSMQMLGGTPTNGQRQSNENRGPSGAASGSSGGAYGYGMTPDGDDIPF
jgi:single-strand DNA-binding protein